MRKKSIFDEVAKNEAGPTMQYAVAVARGMMHMNDPGIDFDLRSRATMIVRGSVGTRRCAWRIFGGWEAALGVVTTAEALEVEYSLRCA